jgi:hypothetical protein
MSRTSRFIIAGWLVAVFAALGLTAANLILGDLNQDEGWYLYAARMVAGGAVTYRDFAYTQGPLLPLVYAPFDRFVAAWGLAGGRLITATLGWLGALLAADLAARLAGPRRREAALLAFALIAVNVYQSYFTTVVKTYSLTACCLTGGFLALAVGLERRRRILLWLAGALMALAAGTRSSAAMAPLATLIVLWVGRRRTGPTVAWLHFAAGGAITGAALILPFFLMAPENFWFNVVSYHTLRDSGALLQALVYKAGFISRMVQAYFVVSALAVAAVLRPGREADKAEPLSGDAHIRLTMAALWATVAGVTLLHLSAPFPYDDYQVFAYPLFGVAVAVFALRRLGTGPTGAVRLALLGVLLSIAAAGSSPLNQEWFIQGRDRIWWQIKDTPPLFKLRAAARQIQELSRPDDYLLTQDPYLAVEANRRLPPGMELGQFCYFPDLDDVQAQRRRVLNRTGLADVLKNCPAPVAALSGYALALESPQIQPVPEEDRAYFRKIIDERYTPLLEIPHFGQAATTLEILVRTPP